MKPLSLVVGSAELPLLRKQTADFAGHRARYGLPVTYEEIPGANHFTIMNEMVSPTGRITTLIRQLLSGWRVKCRHSGTMRSVDPEAHRDEQSRIEVDPSTCRNDMDCCVAALARNDEMRYRYPQPALMPPSTVKITPDV